MNNIIAEMGPIVRCHGALMRLSCENNKPHDLNASLSSFDYAEIMMECRPGCPATHSGHVTNVSHNSDLKSSKLRHDEYDTNSINQQ